MPVYKIKYEDNTEEKIFKKNRDELEKYLLDKKKVFLVRCTNTATVTPSKKLHDNFY